MNWLTGRVSSADGWRLQEFSFAYVRAVAAAAACEVQRVEVDRDSVDLTLKRKTVDTKCRSPQLDVQVKSTSSKCRGDECVRYALDLKNYNELRGSNLAVPRILVIVLVPLDFGDWIRHSEDELALRYCAYWQTLRDAPETANTSTVTVTIPRSQVLDGPGLDAIFTRLASGGLP